MSNHTAEHQDPCAKAILASRVHGCRECGQACAHDFCAASCRVEFNNRRKQRGSELYDLYMAFRFERRAARGLKVLSVLNRLASIWRQQDHHERGGRQSWKAPATVIGRMPHVQTKILERGCL